MFKISLPVQRFVVVCTMVIILMILMNTYNDGFWTWLDEVQNYTTSR